MVALVAYAAARQIVRERRNARERSVYASFSAVVELLQLTDPNLTLVLATLFDVMLEQRRAADEDALLTAIALSAVFFVLGLIAPVLLTLLGLL